VPVIDLQNARSRAEFGKNRVEVQRVGAEFEFVCCVGGEFFFLAKGKKEWQEQEQWQEAETHFFRKKV
jgi:hypothetical protein